MIKYRSQCPRIKARLVNSAPRREQCICRQQLKRSVLSYTSVTAFGLSGICAIKIITQKTFVYKQTATSKVQIRELSGGPFQDKETQGKPLRHNNTIKMYVRLHLIICLLKNKKVLNDSVKLVLKIPSKPVRIFSESFLVLDYTANRTFQTPEKSIMVSHIASWRANDVSTK